MSVTATFGGQTYTFPDGTSDEDIYKAINDSVGRYGVNDPEGYQNNPLLSQETKENTWGIYKEGQDGSILDTAGKNLNSMFENVIAANVEDPTLSNYARRRAKAANAEYQKESAKLGVAGNVISGAAAYGPVIAGGVAGSLVNPLVGAAALGGLGGGAAYADALREQEIHQGEYDTDAAALAGIATGAADVALMGLGSRLRGGSQVVGKALPVGSPTKAVAAALTEDVGSSVAGTAFSNMASGKQWNENLGEAALIGGVAGAGVRGSLNGISKALELPLNSRGEKAINDSVEINNWKGGRKPSETLQRDYAEYENTMGGLQERLANSSDPEESRGLSEALSNASEEYSHISAIYKMSKLLKDGNAHLIDSFYDVDIPTREGSFNLGVDGLGLTKDEMLKAREIIGESKPTLTSDKKAREQGITSESFNEKAKEAGEQILKNARGKINQNKVLIEQAYRKAHQADPSSQTTRNLKDLLGIYSGYNKDMHSADSGTKSVDTLFGAQVASRNIIDLATRTGLYKDMVDVTGQKGALDPLGDYKTILGIADGLLSQDKRFRQGIHDQLNETSKVQKLAEKYGPGGGIAGAGLVGASLVHPGAVPVALAGIGIHEGLGRVRQRRGRKAVESAQANLANLASLPRTKKAVGDAKIKAGVDSGNMELASRGAAESIEAQGFKPIEPISEQAKAKEAVIDDAATAVKVDAIPGIVSNVRQPSPLPRRQPALRAVEEPAAIPVDEVPDVQSNVVPIQPKPKKSRKQIKEERREQRVEPTVQSKTDAIRTWDAENRNQRSEEWIYGAGISNPAFVNSTGGDRIPAHGMAKETTLGSAVEKLRTMLSTGFDKSKTLYYDRLTAKANGVGSSATGTAGGHAYRDGPFILVFKKGLNGEQPVKEDISSVLVNPVNADIIPLLQKEFPNITFREYKDVQGAINQAQESSNNTPTAHTSAVESARAPTKPTPRVEEQVSPEAVVEASEAPSRSTLPKQPKESSRARKKRIREEAKAAEKARAQEESTVVEETPSTEPTPRTKATEQARKPAKPETKAEETPTVAPEPEAPVTRSKATEMAEKPTTPTKEEKAPEVDTEAPKATEETKAEVEEMVTKEPQETKKSSVEMVRKPLEKKVEELSAVPLKNRSVDLVMRLDEAKKDLNQITSITDKLANRFKIPHEKVASYIEEMGGYEAAKKANADAQHKDTNIQHFIGNYIKTKLDSAEATSKATLRSIRESLTAKQRVESTESIEATKAAKFDYAKKKLEAAGVDRETIRIASEKYSDPTLMTTYAKSLEKERLSNIQKQLDESEAAMKKSEKEEGTKLSEVAKFEHAKKKLEASGVDKDVIKIASQKHSDPVLMTTYAKSLEKERLEKARIQLKESEAASKRTETLDDLETIKLDYAKKRLEASGFSKEVIDKALGKYKDPALMVTYAKTLEKERLSEVKKQLETAKDGSQKARDQVNSKEHIREYLDGMKVSGDPELERLFSKVFKHRGDKPITDAQRITLLNKIDEYLDNQKTAYEGLVKKGGTDTPENKAKAATYASMQKTLQENIKKVDAERAEAKAELTRTVKEREDLENMYDKMFVEGEKRAKKVEAVKELDNQIQDLTEALKSMGAPDNYIQKYVHNAFIKHDTALSPKELNKIRAKAVNDLSNLEAKKTKELKSEVAPEIKKLDDSQLEKAVTNHMLDIDETKSSTNPEYAAVSAALEDELVARGMKESAEEISAFQDMMTVAEERKRLLPGDENKDYWISAEDYANLQDKINKGSGSSYMGNLGVKLRLHLFDDRNAEKHIRFTNKVIKNKLEGKGIDDDIIVR